MPRAYVRANSCAQTQGPSRHTTTGEWLDEEDGEENVLRHWRDGYRRRCAPSVTQNKTRDIGGKDSPGAENRYGDAGNKRGVGLVGMLAL